MKKILILLTIIFCVGCMNSSESRNKELMKSIGLNSNYQISFTNDVGSGYSKIEIYFHTPSKTGVDNKIMAYFKTGNLRQIIYMSPKINDGKYIIEYDDTKPESYLTPEEKKKGDELIDDFNDKLDNLGVTVEELEDFLVWYKSEGPNKR